MSVLIVKHVEIEGPGLIEDCLRKQKIPYLIVNLESASHLPKIDDFKSVVLLGGPMNVYEEDRYPFLKEEDLFIKEAIQRGRTVLGICLGAQLIAKALRARVFRAPVKEIGWYDVSLTDEGSEDPFFSKLPKTIPVFQWHGDTFDLPSGANLLATTPHVPHQAFVYGERVYGLQFHLEVTEEMIREWMKDYEEAFQESQTPLVSKLKILSETARRIDASKERGINFFKTFFLRSQILNGNRESKSKTLNPQSEI